MYLLHLEVPEGNLKQTFLSYFITSAVCTLEQNPENLIMANNTGKNPANIK